MHKYPKVRRIGHSSTDGLFASDSHRLIITEKFDGNNFRFSLDENGKIQFGSRNTKLGSDLDEIGGMFENVAQYIVDTVDPDDLRELEERWDQATSASVDSFTYFGENAVQHTISEYDWEEVPQFQLFDVWIQYEDGDGEWCQWFIEDERKEAWEEEDLILDDDGLDYFTVEAIADYLGIETAPVVFTTTVGEFLENDLDEYEVPTSVYREDDGPAEGIVLRNPTTGVKAKYISDEFAERHKSSKQGEMVDPENDNHMLISKHVTERRIEKNVQKLLEEPQYDYDAVEMEMMQDLHEMVWVDVWAEDYEEIIFENWTLDLDRAHNKAASKCAQYLQDLMRSQTMPVKQVDTGTGRVVGEDLEEADS